MKVKKPTLKINNRKKNRVATIHRPASLFIASLAALV